MAAEYICVFDGFQTTVLPIKAGADGRLPAIAVKLKGVRANTKPSKPRCSILFQIDSSESGCSLYISVMY